MYVWRLLTPPEWLHLSKLKTSCYEIYRVRFLGKKNYIKEVTNFFFTDLGSSIYSFHSLEARKPKGRAWAMEQPICELQNIVTFESLLWTINFFA